MWHAHNMRCPPKRLFCQECGFSLPNSSKLKKHKWMQHEKNKCGVVDCDYESPFKGQMSLHRKNKHEGMKELKCDMCKEVYMYKSGLNRHIVKAHIGFSL